MQERNFKRLKEVQGVALFIVNLYLISLSFTSFAPWGTLQFWGWAAIASVVASLQIVFIIQIKTSLKNFISWKNVLGLTMGYLIFTIITFNGSLAFIVNTIEQKSSSVQNESISFGLRRSQTLEAIQRLVTENEEHQKSITEVFIPKNLMTSVERLNIIVAKNRLEIERLEKELSIILEKPAVEGVQEKITTDTFALIAAKIPILKVSGKDYQFFIMLLISLGIEFGLFVTTGTIVNKGKLMTDLTEIKKEINKYIEALFDTDGVRLKSDKKIEEITKIPLKNCMRYKKLIQEQTYNGKPLIYSGKGGTKANFSKEDTIRIMTFILNTQKEID